MAAVREFSPMRPTGELLLKEAIAAHKQGRHSKARFLLDMAARESPRNEFVWLWRAFLAKSRAAAQEYVQEVLRINPDNAKARVWYAKLLPTPAAPPRIESECALCQQRFQGTPTQCPHCHSVLGVGDMDAFLTNEGARRDLIRAAIERIQDDPESSSNAPSQLSLGVAYLNLLQSNQALIHLKRALKLSSDDPDINGAVKSLESRQQVMIVDDSPTIRTAVSGVLERSRFRPVGAEDGFDALARLNEEIPDVIILDIKMPKMDGYQVCKVLKSNRQTRNIPVIMLSGSLIDKVRGKMVGAIEFLSKPFKTEELLKLVEHHAKRSARQSYTFLRT